ncbi:Putative C2H2 type zinc finger domain protein [Penicillium brasilianum]|uniref:Putative C2H2 type zinc finger domain protein n=1 Tax=Penicillium brasilianum TaxID=104259 RepID=A0A0F7U3R9_PENBI|nr:Putative C2H2 type zinc finger domain protein [Penicillium brasilianum]
MREYINRYFEVFHPRWPFIHKGSFNICRETPLLLQAMMVIGMWVSGGQSAQSAAMELHDKLDSAIRDQREKWDASEVEGASSACFWPIATYQAILLHIICSFIMRAGGVVNLDLKTSISAADLDLLQSLVGSCQKLGMFSYPNMLNRYAEADMASYVWVGLEEVKRFDIALYKLCMKLSSGPEDRQLLPASGLDFPLPSNDLLWHSTERHEWDAHAKNENTVNLNDDCRAKWISNFADVLQSICS